MRAIILMFIFSLPLPAKACDLALVLAVDVSGSVDAGEYRVQMGGLANALRDPVVSEALVRADARLMLVQWSGSGRQIVRLPWARVDSFDAVEAFAIKVETTPRRWKNYSTAIGEALSFSVAQFAEVAECKRHLIDLSGDGENNEGKAPADLKAMLGSLDIVVNALAIEASEPDLTDYFFENVIFGEGAFVVTAASFDDYPEKIRKKLLREVTDQLAEASP